jgi:hypothetical protein
VEHHHEHEHGAEHDGSGRQQETHLDFIVAELSPTEAMIRYDCPCGCKPNTEYEKDSTASDYEHCCCGNVHFVGPNARADLEEYLADRKTRGEDDDVGGYEIREEAVPAPWGGTIPVVYGLPLAARKH